MSSLTPYFVQPFLDETFDGYLCRVAAQLGYSSPTWLTSDVGIKDIRNLSEDEISRFCEHYGLDYLRIQGMHSFSSIMGGDSLGCFRRIRDHYVCPVCMRETGYFKQAWVHTLCTACPEHGVQLVPIHDYGNSLGHDVNITPFILLESGLINSSVLGSPASQGEIVLSGLITHPHKVAEVFPLLVKNGELPERFSEFLMLLAELSTGRAHRKNKLLSFNQALQVANDLTVFFTNFEDVFETCVIGRIRNANVRPTGGFIPALGGWYKKLQKDFPGMEYDALRDNVSKSLVKYAEAPINRKMKQIGAELLEDKQALTGSEAARMLNSSLDRIMAMVKSGELKGRIIHAASNEFCMVSRAEVDRLRREAGEFLDSAQVMEILGIPKRLKERLIDCEVLVPVSDASRSKFARGKFSRAAVYNLLSRLEENVSPQDCAAESTLSDISRRRLNKSVSDEIYQEIFSGHLKCCRIDHFKSDMDRFLFNDDDIDAIIEGSKRKVELSVEDMNGLYNYKHAEVVAWIDDGLLQARREKLGKHNRYFISLPELGDFSRRYVPLSKLARDMDKLPVHLAKSLGARGLLSDSVGSEGNSRRGLLVDVIKLVTYALEH
ncbi:TniQ family protein [Metapseudomonas furukawaii]|uniref:TniQ family protein n=1 Tax=Metapseudomonas furukawaii TaxID=1149133 RepID=UPI00227A1A76|nr:TniQ family protein [Pseudomonas furukawaii]WAG79134.1 TniQ family protein [Pseudomonas furukawaii]